MANLEEIKDEILQKLDIVDVISDYVDLRKRGANYVGLCPFHNEKTPSFNVSSEKGIYKCFGCGAAGNLITFVMDYEKLNFQEAIKALAKKAGIQYQLTKETNKEVSKYDLAYQALIAARDFFVKTLKTNAGNIATEYYVRRGFTKDTIIKFGLGYSPNSWDSLINELHKKGFSNEVLQNAGLIIKKEDKDSFYDRFRDRAMFPIPDNMGRVIGFGARRLNDDDTQPKYINSPQSLVYDKSRSLYGLYHARNELRNKKAAILVEGYIDVITLHQAGITNVIASSGTSLTSEQLDILARYGKKLYLVFDSDSAGVKATDRALEIAIEKGFDIYILQLPKGEDPDSFVKNHGGELFNIYLDGSVSFLEFKINKLKEEGKLNNPQSKAEAARDIVRIISKIPDRLQHDDYIANLARYMNFSEFQLQQIYKEKNEIEKKDKKQKKRENVEHQKDNAFPVQEIDVNLKSKLQKEEYILLETCLAETDGIKTLFSNENFNMNLIISSEGKRLFTILENLYSITDNVVDELMADESISESDRDFLVKLSFKGHQFDKKWEKYIDTVPTIDIKKTINDTLIRLSIKQLDIQIQELMQIQKVAPFEEQLKATQQIQELSNKKIKLNKSIQKIFKEN